MVELGTDGRGQAASYEHFNHELLVMLGFP